MAGFKKPGWLHGAIVSFAGEYPWQMTPDAFKNLIVACDGTFQRSPVNCHLLVYGEDAGERPMRARESNPGVLIWTYEKFQTECRIATKPREEPIYLFPNFVKVKDESYGSF